MKRVMVLLLALGLQASLWAANPDRLSDENYVAVRKHVDLRPGDLRFQQVEWHERFYDGVARAQKEDKPLLLWLYFGDPRGNC